MERKHRSAIDSCTTVNALLANRRPHAKLRLCYCPKSRAMPPNRCELTCLFMLTSVAPCWCKNLKENYLYLIFVFVNQFNQFGNS